MNLSGSPSKPSRYQQPPRKARGGIPSGWSKPDLTEAAQVQQVSLTSAFERALANPVYDQNSASWDEVLRTLNLRTCYQPAVARVLSEGRWRNTDNPKAYVARAAANQALSMRLPDFTDRTFRRVSGEEKAFDSGDQATRRQSISSPRYDKDGELMPDVVEGAADVGDPPSAWERIPVWLQRDEEADAVDWHKVAQYAARKPGMAPALGKALGLRAAGISRPRAAAMAKSNAEAREIESAWKWIDREWDSRIAPLFHREKPPVIAVARSGPRPARGRKGFIAPWEAIREACEPRHRNGTDLICSPGLRQASEVAEEIVRSLHLPAGISIAFAGGNHYGVRALLKERAADRSLLIEGDTMGDVLEIVREALDELADGLPVFGNVPNSPTDRHVL
jgi:hypothetical protein